MPVPQGKGNDNRNLYYSFDWGPIHYVIVSTETDFLEGSAQYKWTVVCTRPARSEQIVIDTTCKTFRETGRSRKCR